MRIVGLDIGGANLKAADSRGAALSRPFAVWKAPERLSHEISRLLAEFEAPEAVALTMTAELADCYRTKGEGVTAILDAVERAAGAIPIAVWTTSGELLAPDAVRRAPLAAAAANWHVLATFAGRLAGVDDALLIDVGSTTTDLIPISNGVPVPSGHTDCGRLDSGELVYTGVRRTPVCAVTQTVPFRGKLVPVAAELFATTLDVYLTLGDLSPDPADLETADGRPATIANARERLARCLCCDSTEFLAEDAVVLARAVAGAQRRQIARGLHAVLAAQHVQPGRLILSGSGSFVGERLLEDEKSFAGREKVLLSAHLGPRISEAACAYALAVLAAERGPFAP